MVPPGDVEMPYWLHGVVVSMTPMAKEDRSVLGWFAFIVSVTALALAENPGVWAWNCHILTHTETSTGMFGMVTALIVEE